MLKYQKIPQEIIQRYKPYRNTNKKWKKIKSHRQWFQIYEQYELSNLGKQIQNVESSSQYVIIAKDKEKAEEEAIVAIKKEYIGKEVLTIFKNTEVVKALKYYKLGNYPPSKIKRVTQLNVLHTRQRYVVFEKMDCSLHQIIRSNQELTQEHNRFFLYQIMRALKYIHSANIAHRNISPRQILVNSNCDLKIGGFGCARCLSQRQRANILSQYIAVRWYRAPELIFQEKCYTKAIDMWSVGCIFAEMLQRRPFLAGSDTKNQLQLMCEYFGQDLANTKNISEGSRDIIKAILDKKFKVKTIEQTFSFAHPLAVDLLKKLLAADPQKRITAVQALNHPYLESLHLEEDEPTAEQVNLLEFQFEDYNLNTQQLKDLIYEEILLYHFRDFWDEQKRKKANNESLIMHILKNPILNNNNDDE